MIKLQTVLFHLHSGIYIVPLQDNYSEVPPDSSTVKKNSSQTIEERVRKTTTKQMQLKRDAIPQ